MQRPIAGSCMQQRSACSISATQRRRDQMEIVFCTPTPVALDAGANPRKLRARRAGLECSNDSRRFCHAQLSARRSERRQPRDVRIRHWSTLPRKMLTSIERSSHDPSALQDVAHPAARLSGRGSACGTSTKRLIVGRDRNDRNSGGGARSTGWIHIDRHLDGAPIDRAKPQPQAGLRSGQILRANHLDRDDPERAIVDPNDCYLGVKRKCRFASSTSPP